MELFRRENYLKKIRGFYHATDIIKVITGVRRCGKSSLMQMIADELREGGVKEDQIIFLNLDKRGYRKIKTADQLDELIASFPKCVGMTYLFIDEIQNVKDFEEVINAYREEGEYSIFITGSNSYLLSGELATKLTGRYVEIEMFPLTFDEYLEMKAFYGKTVDANLSVELNRFILEGGFPRTILLDDLADKRSYTESVVSEIFEKDIRKRVKVRKVSVFETVQLYIINNFGATMSLTNILDDLKKNGCPIRRETLNRYIHILEDAKIIYPCERFDLKSRRSISGEQKYYLADLGFYFALNTDKRINYGPALENVVYTYARSKGYYISVGRIGKLECDFILGRSNMDYSYVQVAMTIMSSIETENREYRPLESIKDNYPKYVITRNDLIQHRSGIIHANIAPFMKENQLF